MFKFLSLLSIIVQCYASYGSFVGGGGGGGGNGLGYANTGGAIPAAVKSIWRLDIKPVQLPQEPIVPQVIEIPALEMPVKILYHSKSSGVFVQQIHSPGEPGQAEATRTEEEPHKLTHEVVRPVIQELREIIIPYRRVIQEIAPVVEEVQTIVSRGEGRQNAFLGQGGGGGVLPNINAGSAANAGVIGLGGGLGISGTITGGSLFGGVGGHSGLMGGGMGGYGANLQDASLSGKKGGAKRAK